MNMQHGHRQATLTWALTSSMDNKMGMHITEGKKYLPFLLLPLRYFL
jgi:hypothetical protein